MAKIRDTNVICESTYGRTCKPEALSKPKEMSMPRKALKGASIPPAYDNSFLCALPMWGMA